MFRVIQNDSVGRDYNFYLYITKNSGYATFNILGNKMANQSFTWSGTTSTSSPASPNYINAQIYKMFSTRQPPAIGDIPNLQTTLSSKTNSDDVGRIIDSYYTSGGLLAGVDNKYEFTCYGASTAWLKMGSVNINETDLQFSKEIFIKVVMSQSKDYNLDNVLFIHFKSSNTYQNTTNGRLYGNVSYYVMNTYTINPNAVPKLYMSFGILNNGSGNYHNYNFYLYLGNDCDGKFFYQVNGTTTFVYDGILSASISDAIYNVPPAILYNTLNSDILTKTKSNDLYGGIYSLPGSWGWGETNPGLYYVYVGHYTTANDASTSDMLLEFVGHSYWDNPGKGQDSMTSLRFKGGNTALGVFQGNGQAYYIGSQSHPSVFIIKQSQVSISPTETRKRFHVFAGFGNYSNGSSVIVKCNSFVYIGIGGVNPDNYPAIFSQAQIVITPIKIFTADYGIDLRTVGPQSIKIAPPTDKTEASIAFYRYNDERVNVAGDYWVMGHGAFGSGPGGFSIGTYNLGPCLTIGTDGAVSFPRSKTKTLS